jgi:hypothetical protein
VIEWPEMVKPFGKEWTAWLVAKRNPNGKCRIKEGHDAHAHSPVTNTASLSIFSY